MTEDELKAIEAKCDDSDDSSDEYSHGPTMTDECRELVAEVRRLRGLIKRVEWSYRNAAENTVCAFGCDKPDDRWRDQQEHSQDCHAFTSEGFVK